MLPRVLFAVVLLVFAGSVARAQQGYEFEVYDTGIGARGSTEVELASNYVVEGLKKSVEGQYPTHHALRSSVELTRTLSNWLQASAYVTADARPSRALSYVGNRFKLTAIAPSTWRLPFDLGLANEISYARPGYAEFRWAYEITPIVTTSFGSVSLVFNPAFERGLSGSGEHHIEMEPRGKLAYDFGDDASIALEYYAGLGGVGENYSIAEQRHQIFARLEAEVSRHLEVGLGVGRGLTRSSDGWVIATVLEYKAGPR
jgi:hypothetical protein